mmetsp:Transcript_30168/g.85044  ORF Transcript_30168/g.85044 Transcript_30168/m.85044 type:complete len:254 (+) Transcript_30168:331-1092(+)
MALEGRGARAGPEDREHDPGHAAHRPPGQREEDLCGLPAAAARRVRPGGDEVAARPRRGRRGLGEERCDAATGRAAARRSRHRRLGVPQGGPLPPQQQRRRPAGRARGGHAQLGPMQGRLRGRADLRGSLGPPRAGGVRVHAPQTRGALPVHAQRVVGSLAPRPGEHECPDNHKQPDNHEDDSKFSGAHEYSEGHEHSDGHGRSGKREQSDDHHRPGGHAEQACPSPAGPDHDAGRRTPARPPAVLLRGREDG